MIAHHSQKELLSELIVWFNLRQGCANENASPNAPITGEDTPVPPFQLVLIQAWPSPLPTPASIDLNLSRIVKRASNQPKDCLEKNFLPYNKTSFLPEGFGK